MATDEEKPLPCGHKASHHETGVGPFCWDCRYPKPDLAAFLASYQTLRAAEKALDAASAQCDGVDPGELADALDTAREAFVTTAEQFAAVWIANRAGGLRWTPAKCDGCKATMGYALVPASPHWSPAKCPECYHQGAKS